MISEPSGSKELSGELSISRPTPKIAQSRVYTYDEMIEHRKKLNDSYDFEFDISNVEKKF